MHVTVSQDTYCLFLTPPQSIRPSLSSIDSVSKIHTYLITSHNGTAITWCKLPSWAQVPKALSSCLLILPSSCNHLFVCLFIGSQHSTHTSHAPSKNSQFRELARGRHAGDMGAGGGGGALGKGVTENKV